MKYFLTISKILFILLILPPLSSSVQAETKRFPRTVKNSETARAPQQGQPWTDPTTGMEFVWVDWDCFLMGSLDTDREKGPDEGPAHNVCIDALWVGKYEVTVKQFEKFVQETGYRSQAEYGSGCYVWNGIKWSPSRKASWRTPNHAQDANHPVTCVSWNDANKFAEWLNSRYRNVVFRLPTEAEWEFTARATTWTVRPWGKNPNQACEYANIADLSAQKKWPAWPVHECDDSFAATAPVGSFKPNKFGLFDTIGNVWEWCSDWYSYASYYQKSPDRNPKGPGNGINRIFRGGSWSHGPKHVRSAARARISPKSSTDFIGFRLVLEPPNRSLTREKPIYLGP